MASGGLKTVQGGSETLPRGLPEGSKKQISLIFQLFLKVFWVLPFSGRQRSKTAEEAPNIVPRQPERPPEGSEHGPRGPQNGPRGANNGSRAPQDGPRGPQEGPMRAPRGPKEAPKRAQEAPKTAKEVPKTAQEGPKRGVPIDWRSGTAQGSRLRGPWLPGVGLKEI